jgi:phosphate transport system permease protein
MAGSNSGLIRRSERGSYNPVTFNKKKFRFSDWFAEQFIRAVAFLSIAFVILIFFFVFREAFPIFRMNVIEKANTAGQVQERYGMDNKATAPSIMQATGKASSGEAGVKADTPSSTLLKNQWMPVSDNPRYGLLPLFLGTLKVTIIALLFAAPIAILAAIYTSMFAKPGLREVIKPMIELLAGFPSVVIGFFALMVLATLLQNIFG